MNNLTASYVCYFIIVVIVVCIMTAKSLIFNNDYEAPGCYIKEFYVPALDLSQLPTTSNSRSNNNNNNNKDAVVINPCLFFDLAFYNSEGMNALRYGDINLTFSYDKSAIANYVVPSFDQETLETDYRREVVESSGVPWQNALKAVSNGSTVVFRVDMAARPKYKKGFGWFSKKKDVRIGADVEVDGSGMKVNKKDIWLDYAASQHRVGTFVLFLSLLVTFRWLFF